MVKCGKYCRAGQVTGDNMKHAFTCQITKTTDKHSEYAIVIAFPQQHLSNKHASMLQYTYITCFL